MTSSMTSRQLFNKRAVSHLIGSVLRDDTKPQICTSIKRKDYTTLVVNNNSNAKNPIRAEGYRVPAEHQPDNVTHGTFNLFRTVKQSATNNSRRQTSTSTVASATATHSLKRDASTQAQQQQVELVDQQNCNNCDSFRCSELEIVPCPPNELRQKPSVDKLVFGHAFTDHMFRVDWDHENGWTTPLISKVHNLDLHPGAKVLHYALEAFEGAKAFRGHDNKIRFFRLEQNIRRLLHSARRLSLPDFDEVEFIKCIHKLVQLDQDWIPKSKNQQQLTSLYVRPTILGVEPSLGVASSKKAILYVLLSPVGPYFKTGFKPVSLYADPDFIRAWPGGAGNTKLGSNYAPTIMVQKQAEKLGLQQVLWLYGEDRKLTEVGTMNIFVSYRNAETGKLHLVTPPLTDGLILPGITRASILDLARQWNDVVCEERYLTISEIEQLIHENRLVEMFGSGTACIVCPINSIQMKDGSKLHIPYCDITDASPDYEGQDVKEIPLTRRILKAITDIQYGKIPHSWAKELRY